MKVDETKLVYALQDFLNDLGMGLDMTAPSHVRAVNNFKVRLESLLKNRSKCPNSTPKSSTR